MRDVPISTFLSVAANGRSLVSPLAIWARVALAPTRLFPAADVAFGTQYSPARFKLICTGEEAMLNAIRRELQVACSTRHQPVWVRLVKWILIMTAIVTMRNKPYFWTLAGVTTVLALALHFFYRWKTRSWTLAWGGWNDVQPPG